tara:strand:- start:1082 stop:1867 length:786 start_codon:yes stop_codon:yes gene_type:complete
MKKFLGKGYTFFETNLQFSNIPTIFIHGVGLNSTMWRPQKKFFNNNKKNTIYYDLLNHGKSESGFKKLSFFDFSNQLLQLIEFLKIKKFNLVGFSIGALIAQHFAEKHSKKINKLIIIASIYNRSDEQRKKIIKRYKDALQGNSISDDSIRRWFNADYLKLNPKIYDYFFNILEKKLNENFLPAYKLFVNADKYKVDFSNFNIPTLIMTGENDVGSTPEMSQFLSKEIKNSNVCIIPKAKHMVTFEKANLVNIKISNFLFK